MIFPLHQVLNRCACTLLRDWQLTIKKTREISWCLIARRARICAQRRRSLYGYDWWKWYFFKLKVAIQMNYELFIKVLFFLQFLLMNSLRKPEALVLEKESAPSWPWSVPLVAKVSHLCWLCGWRVYVLVRNCFHCERKMNLAPIQYIIKKSSVHLTRNVWPIFKWFTFFCYYYCWVYHEY